MDVECIVDCRNTLGETPFWQAAEEALYWVDIEGALLQRYDWNSKRYEKWSFAERVCGAAPRRSGGVILALERKVVGFDPSTGRMELIAELEPAGSPNRLNDAKCDRHGRFWVGAMNDALSGERSASLYCVEADGSFRIALDGIGTSNSIAWSPDDRLFYFADSVTREISVFDFDIAEGAISNPRLFSDCHEHRGAPDGSTVDCQGMLWNAVWDEWCLVRYNSDGTIDRRLQVPVQKPTSCAFGGPNMMTLFITSAIWDLKGPSLSGQPAAGGLFMVDAGVTGITEPSISG